MDWKRELVKWGCEAWASGQRLEFSVVRRQGVRKWRIEMKRVVEHGEEEGIVEED